MSVKHFFYLSELDIPVKVRVTSIEGKTVHDQLIREVLATPGESATPLIQLYVTGQIYSNGAPLGLPASTTIITFSGPNIVFNEWLTFPVTYKDLSPSSCFVFTLWKIEPPAPYPSRPGVSPLLPINSSSSTSPSSAKVIDSLSRLPPTLGSSFIPPLGQSLSEAVQLGSAGMTPRQTPLGGSCMPVFNKAGMVKLGTRRLYLWPGVQGDGTQNTTTPYKDPSQKALKEAWSNSLLQEPYLQVAYDRNGNIIPPHWLTSALNRRATPKASVAAVLARCGGNLNISGGGTSSNPPNSSSNSSGSSDSKIGPTIKCTTSTAVEAAQSTLASSSLSHSPSPPMPPPLFSQTTPPHSRVVRDLQRAIRDYYFNANNTDAHWLVKYPTLNALASARLDQLIQAEHAGAAGMDAGVSAGLSSVMQAIKANHKPLSAIAQFKKPSISHEKGEGGGHDGGSQSSATTPNNASNDLVNSSNLTSSLSSALCESLLYSTFEEKMFLIIDMPPFRYPIAYHTAPSSPVPAIALPPSLLGPSSGSSPTPAPPGGSLNPCFRPDRQPVLLDPAAFRPHPVDLKYRKLTAKLGYSQVHLKPGQAERLELEMIVTMPLLTRLTLQQRNLVKRYRHSLVRNKRALTCFLRVVDWSDPSSVEVNDAIELMNEWTPIDPADALELLSSSFQHPAVREYGIRILKAAPDSEILTYLLQLVQALRYELKYPSALSTFLIERATANFELANFFYWYLIVETTDKAKGQMFLGVFSALQQSLKESKPDWLTMLNQQEAWLKQILLLIETINPKSTRDAEGLLRQVVSDKGSFSHLKSFSPIVLPLQPPLRACGTLPEKSTFFSSKQRPLKLCLRLSDDPCNNITPLNEGTNAPGSPRSSSISTTLSNISSPPPLTALSGSSTSSASHSGGSSEIKVDNVSGTSTPGSVGVGGGGLFKAMNYSSSHLSSHSHLGKQILRAGAEYHVLLKTGDDLRQDQLVIQMFNLMDALLKRVNLDLRLTPYRVLATSTNTGFVEFVAESEDIQRILQKFDGDLSKYLEQYNNHPSLMERARDNFVKSSAGYCITTYILGVGDRHLENIMLTKDGHLFHIDFGFIFGSDPKVYRLPPMKILKEMVSCMGGKDSAGYKAFGHYCASAFNQLRKHANLFLNLLSLMVDANIPDLSDDPQGRLMKVQDKFRLDLTNEEAEHYILKIVDDSLSDMMSTFNDQMHKIASTFRK